MRFKYLISEWRIDMKKIFSVLATIALFITTASVMIFAVCVAIHYVQYDELTYKVAPVRVILNHFDKDDSKDDIEQVNKNNNKKSDKKDEEQDNTLEQLVENVMPAVVAISCELKNTAPNAFLEDLYDYDSTASSGSGFIIAQNSHEVLIVTNNHVVEGAKNVKVTFCDDNIYEATVKGADATSDLAVISVMGKDMKDSTIDNIKIASLGNSDSLKVGDIAIAIGNSMGYGQSVTKGVISALDRTVSVEDSTMRLLQTDAAINPGNSGGALLNGRGEVIGINSVKYVSQDTESIGYAIPISIAVPIINELINYEELTEEEQAYFGIVAYTVSEQMISYFNCSKGAYIKEVTKGSPAEEANLYAGDIITGFAGRTISSMEELQNILQYKRGGSECEVIFERLENGKYVEHKVTVTFINKGDVEE